MSGVKLIVELHNRLDRIEKLLKVIKNNKIVVSAAIIAYAVVPSLITIASINHIVNSYVKKIDTLQKHEIELESKLNKLEKSK